jgi:hypothetical protein
MILKRNIIKYVRDYIKKDYKLRDKCYICSTAENLELHHIYAISQLFSIWCEKNNIQEITTVEQITELRVQFYKDEYEKLNNSNLYTLCKTHHEKLHNIYGQKYSNHLVPKILNWMLIQKGKHD